MKLEELEQAWKKYDQKLSKQLMLNQQILKEINMQKTRSHLQWHTIRTLLEMAFFSMITIALSRFMYQHIEQTSIFIAALVLTVFVIIGLSGSIGQMIFISQLDFSEPVTIIQHKLQQIRTHLVQVLRLIILSIPFYLAYIVLGFYILGNIDIVAQGDETWWIVQIIISVALVPVAIWLYGKIHYRNIHIPWVKNLIENAGGKSVAQAMAVLGELEEFNQD